MTHWVIVSRLRPVHIVPSNDPPKGMGEPALANTVARLTGKRLREMPFRMA